MAEIVIWPESYLHIGPTVFLALQALLKLENIYRSRSKGRLWEEFLSRINRPLQTITVPLDKGKLISYGLCGEVVFTVKEDHKGHLAGLISGACNS